MSETPNENPTDGVVYDITESPEEIVKPIPPGISEDEPPTDPRPLTAAQRVRERIERARGGAAGDAEHSQSAPRATPRDKPRKDAPPKPREGSLVKPLTDLYTTLGMMLAPFDPACSVAFIDNAHNCAVSMEKLARENESVRRVIVALTQTSAWGGAIIAHMPIILVIMMHHGPPQVAERIAPLAFLMNAETMQRAAQAQQDAQEAPSEPQNGASDAA